VTKFTSARDQKEFYALTVAFPDGNFADVIKQTTSLPFVPIQNQKIDIVMEPAVSREHKMYGKVTITPQP